MIHSLILVIEDNPDVRANMAELLEVANYRVITAPNGKEGVRLANGEKPDLILCDIMMPELDGYGVLHILSKKSDTAYIPFIFLTARAEKSDVRKGMSLGADDYLVKPFDEIDLLSAVEARLKKKALLSAGEVSSDDFAAYPENPEEVRKVFFENDFGHDCEFRLIKKKTKIFTEGENPNYVYFIKTGVVKTIRIHPDGKELITNLYKANDFFGFEPLLEGRPHPETAITMKECEVISISSRDFLSLIQANSSVSCTFISLLCKKVEEKDLRLLHLAYSSVRQRTAEALLKLWEGNKTPMSMSREDLAKVVGTASESVIRILSDFRDEKLIDIDSAKITLRTPDGLRQVMRWNVARGI